MSETIRTDADDAIVAAEAAEAGVPADSPADSPVAARAADDGRNVDFTNTNRWDTRQLVTMALMCAIGVLLSFIEFPLLPGVTWLKYDASAMPAMVSGFAFGPAAGLAVGIVGAVMNILVIMGFVWPAALIYSKRHTLKGAIAGLAVGVVAATVMAIVGNLLVTPSWLGVPLQAVIDMIVPILTPFNLIKAVLNAVLTLVVYKSTSNLVTPKKKQVKGR